MKILVKWFNDADEPPGDALGVVYLDRGYGPRTEVATVMRYNGYVAGTMSDGSESFSSETMKDFKASVLEYLVSEKVTVKNLMSGKDVELRRVFDAAVETGNAAEAVCNALGINVWKGVEP